MIEQPPIIIYNQPDCILPKSFFEGRFMPNMHEDSLDYEQWCSEQTKRCLEGWSDGGYYVTGPYYYHLNFKKINMLNKQGRPMLYHPYYSFEDQQLFNDVKLARSQEKGLFLITFRGFGKSFDVSSICEHEFTFQPASECIVSASTIKFVDRLWERVMMGINSQPEWLRPNFLVDKATEKVSGYTEIDEVSRKSRDEGYGSILRKIAYDNDEEKTRGTRPDIHAWEEVGSWTGAAKLLNCYKKTEPSWWRGSRNTCFPIFLGTGGAMDTGGSVDAKLMFFNPDVYNLLAFEYKDTKIGKFVPGYKKLEGYYEKTGESDEVGAKEFLDNRRKKKEGNPDLFRQETMEFPFDPHEAFQVTGAGAGLPSGMLEDRYMAIERDPALQIVQRGNLHFERTGSTITGVKWEADKEGIFEIVEHPMWTREGWTEGILHNLYIAGCDSFDAIEEDGGAKRYDKSPGSNIIFKRFRGKANETSRLFVAKITQRTDDASEFYWNTIKLNLYYNARMLGEYTKLGIFTHYINNGFEKLLYPRPLLDSSVKNSKATQKYGVQMPSEVKVPMIKNYGKYLKENMDQMYFQSLCLDGADFTFEGRDKGKHDETMAAAIAYLGDMDMYNVSIKEANRKTSGYFPKMRRNALGQLVFD